MFVKKRSEKSAGTPRINLDNLIDQLEKFTLRTRTLKNAKGETRETRTLKNKVKDIVVLDLDETLVSAIDEASAKTLPEKVHKTAKIFGSNELFIFSRPGLCKFLQTLEERYTIVIWTAGTQDYGIFVNDNIITPCLKKPIPSTLVFHRTQVELSEKITSGVYHKDLSLLAKILGVDAERMFIIDNRSDVFKQRKPGRSIQIIDWVVTEDPGLHDRFLAMLPDVVNKLI